MTLRQAAQAALDALMLEATEPPIPQTGAAIDALRAALAQPEPQPTRAERVTQAMAAADFMQPVAVPQGEPVAQWRKHGTAPWCDGYPDPGDGAGPYETRTLYAQPAAPVCQPLTDEQIEQMRVNCLYFSEADECNVLNTTAFARAIEAQHGIGGAQ